MSRLALVAALEALEVGDQRLAVDILLAAIEDDGERVERVRCDACGLGFTWPGLRAAHRAGGCPAAWREAA